MSKKLHTLVHVDNYCMVVLCRMFCDLDGEDVLIHSVNHPPV